MTKEEFFKKAKELVVNSVKTRIIGFRLNLLMEYYLRSGNWRLSA